jgi:hypothetical protein
MAPKWYDDPLGSAQRNPGFFRPSSQGEGFQNRQDESTFGYTPDEAQQALNKLERSGQWESFTAAIGEPEAKALRSLAHLSSIPRRGPKLLTAGESFHGTDPGKFAASDLTPLSQSELARRRELGDETIGMSSGEIKAWHDEKLFGVTERQQHLLGHKIGNLQVTPPIPDKFRRSSVDIPPHPQFAAGQMLGPEPQEKFSSKRGRSASMDFAIRAQKLAQLYQGKIGNEGSSEARLLPIPGKENTFGVLLKVRDAGVDREISIGEFSEGPLNTISFNNKRVPLRVGQTDLEWHQETAKTISGVVQENRRRIDSQTGDLVSAVVLGEAVRRPIHKTILAGGEDIHETWRTSMPQARQAEIVKANIPKVVDPHTGKIRDVAIGPGIGLPRVGYDIPVVPEATLDPRTNEVRSQPFGVEWLRAGAGVVPGETIAPTLKGRRIEEALQARESGAGHLRQFGEAAAGTGIVEYSGDPSILVAGTKVTPGGRPARRAGAYADDIEPAGESNVSKRWRNIGRQMTIAPAGSTEVISPWRRITTDPTTGQKRIHEPLRGTLVHQMQVTDLPEGMGLTAHDKFLEKDYQNKRLHMPPGVTKEHITILDPSERYTNEKTGELVVAKVDKMAGGYELGIPVQTGVQLSDDFLNQGPSSISWSKKHEGLDVLNVEYKQQFSARQGQVADRDAMKGSMAYAIGGASGYIGKQQHAVMQERILRETGINLPIGTITEFPATDHMRGQAEAWAMAQFSAGPKGQELLMSMGVSRGALYGGIMNDHVLDELAQAHKRYKSIQFTKEGEFYEETVNDVIGGQKTGFKAPGQMPQDLIQRTRMVQRGAVSVFVGEDSVFGGKLTGRTSPGGNLEVQYGIPAVSMLTTQMGFHPVHPGARKKLGYMQQREVRAHEAVLPGFGQELAASPHLFPQRNLMDVHLRNRSVNEQGYWPKDITGGTERITNLKDLDTRFKLEVTKKLEEKRSLLGAEFKYSDPMQLIDVFEKVLKSSGMGDDESSLKMLNGDILPATRMIKHFGRMDGKQGEFTPILEKYSAVLAAELYGAGLDGGQYADISTRNPLYAEYHQEEYDLFMSQEVRRQAKGGVSTEQVYDQIAMSTALPDGVVALSTETARIVLGNKQRGLVSVVRHPMLDETKVAAKGYAIAITAEEARKKYGVMVGGSIVLSAALVGGQQGDLDTDRARVLKVPDDRQQELVAMYKKVFIEETMANRGMTREEAEREVPADLENYGPGIMFGAELRDKGAYIPENQRDIADSELGAKIFWAQSRINTMAEWVKDMAEVNKGPAEQVLQVLRERLTHGSQGNLFVGERQKWQAADTRPEAKSVEGLTGAEKALVEAENERVITAWSLARTEKRMDTGEASSAETTAAGRGFTLQPTAVPSAHAANEEAMRAKSSMGTTYNTLFERMFAFAVGKGGDEAELKAVTTLGAMSYQPAPNAPGASPGAVKLMEKLQTLGVFARSGSGRVTLGGRQLSEAKLGIPGRDQQEAPGFSYSRKGSAWHGLMSDIVDDIIHTTEVPDWTSKAALISQDEKERRAIVEIGGLEESNEEKRTRILESLAKNRKGGDYEIGVWMGSNKAGVAFRSILGFALARDARLGTAPGAPDTELKEFHNVRLLAEQAEAGIGSVTKRQDQSLEPLPFYKSLYKGPRAHDVIQNVALSKMGMDPAHDADWIKTVQSYAAPGIVLGRQLDQQGQVAEREWEGITATSSWYGNQSEFMAMISPSEGEMLEGMRKGPPAVAKQLHKQFGMSMVSSHYARSAVNSLKSNEIIQGFAAGTYGGRQALYRFNADKDAWLADVAGRGSGSDKPPEGWGAAIKEIVGVVKAGFGGVIDLNRETMVSLSEGREIFQKSQFASMNPEQYKAFSKAALRASEGEDVMADVEAMEGDNRLAPVASALLSDIQSFARDPKSSLKGGRKLGQRLNDALDPAARGDRDIGDETLTALGAYARELAYEKLPKGHAMGEGAGIPGVTEGTRGVLTKQQESAQEKLATSTTNLTARFDALGQSMAQAPATGRAGRLQRRAQQKEWGVVAQLAGGAQQQAKMVEQLAGALGEDVSTEDAAAIAEIAGVGAGLGGMMGDDGPGGPGGGVGGPGGGRQQAPFLNRLTQAFGGFEMMYMQRMLGIATGGMKRGMQALTQQEAQAQGGFFMGGGMVGGYQGQAGKFMQRQARGEAAWANLGRTTEATYGGLLDLAGTAPGAAAVGFGANVAMPSIFAGMGATHLAKNLLPAGGVLKNLTPSLFGKSFTGGLGAGGIGLITAAALAATAGGMFMAGQGEEDVVQSQLLDLAVSKGGGVLDLNLREKAKLERQQEIGSDPNGKWYNPLSWGPALGRTKMGMGIRGLVTGMWGGMVGGTEGLGTIGKAGQLGIYDPTMESLTKWNTMMAGGAGQMSGLTPSDIQTYTKMMTKGPLEGISVDAQAKIFGQFGPAIDAVGYDMDVHRRLSTQVQMGGKPYEATMGMAALTNVSPVNFEAIGEMMKAVSKVDQTGLKTMEYAAQMLSSVSGPLEMAEGKKMVEMKTTQIEATRDVTSTATQEDYLASLSPAAREAAKSQVSERMPSGAKYANIPVWKTTTTETYMKDETEAVLDPNLEKLLKTPPAMELYGKAIKEFQQRLTWDPNYKGQEPKIEDFLDYEEYDATWAKENRRLTRRAKFTGISEQMRWAKDQPLLGAATGLRAQGMMNQMQQQRALAPQTVLQQIQQAQFQMYAAEPMAAYQGAAQLASARAMRPYQRAIGLEQAEEQASWQTYMGGASSQYGFTGNFGQARGNMDAIRDLGLSPNVSSKLAGMPYGAQMAQQMGGTQALLAWQGRGADAMPMFQQQTWDLQGTNAPTSTSLGGALYYNRAREDRMYGLSLKGQGMREARFGPQWQERRDQFDLQRDRQEYGFDYQRQQLMRTRAGQALSGRGMDLRQRGLDLGMAQFQERFAMQSSWAQTQFENQQADMQRQRGQQMQMRGFAQADMPLQRRQFEMGQIETQQRIQFREQDIPRQRGYQLADVSFQQGQTARQFGWQMEDMDENIRFATGRGRRRLLRQRGRLVESRNIATGREDEMEDRRETEWEIEDERFEIIKERTEEIINIDAEMYDRREEKIRTQWQFEDENFGIRQDRMQEARDHQVAMMDMQKRHFEENHALQQDQFNLQKERHALQQKNIDAQLAHLLKQEEFAQTAHDQAETRMANEKEHATAMMALQRDQIEAGAMFRDELRGIADSLRAIEHERVKMDAMRLAMSLNVDPSEWAQKQGYYKYDLEAMEGLGEQGAGGAGLPTYIKDLTDMSDEMMSIFSVWSEEGVQAAGDWSKVAEDQLNEAGKALIEMNNIIKEEILPTWQEHWINLGITAEETMAIITASFGGSSTPSGSGGDGASGGNMSPRAGTGGRLSSGDSGGGGGLAGTAVGAVATIGEAFLEMSETVRNTYILGEKEGLLSGWTEFFKKVGVEDEGLLGQYQSDWVVFFEGDLGILKQMELLLNTEHLGGIAPIIDNIAEATNSVTTAVGLMVTAAENAVKSLEELLKGGVYLTKRPEGVSEDDWKSWQNPAENASGFHGLVNRGDYLVRGGRKMSVAEHGSEWLDVWPSEASGGRGGGGDVSAALNGMKVQLVVDGNQMDGYLRTRERTNLYRESFR